MDRELEKVNDMFRKKNQDAVESVEQEVVEPPVMNFEFPEKYSDYDEENDCIVGQHPSKERFNSSMVFRAASSSKAHQKLTLSKYSKSKVDGYESRLKIGADNKANKGKNKIGSSHN
jgi:hypothetical protein